MFACLPVCLSLPASLPLHVSLPAAYTKATPCKGKTCCGYTSLALVTCCPHCFVAPLALVNCCSPCSGQLLPPLLWSSVSPPYAVHLLPTLLWSPVAPLALVTCCLYKSYTMQGEDMLWLTFQARQANVFKCKPRPNGSARIVFIASVQATPCKGTQVWTMNLPGAWDDSVDLALAQARSLSS